MECLPKSVTLHQEEDKLVIQVRRSGLIEWFSEIVLALLSLGFLVFPLSGLINILIHNPEGFWVFGNIISIPFILLGFIMFYRFLTILLDSAYIELSREQIRVRYLPLPVWDDSTVIVPVSMIREVETKMKISKRNQNRPSSLTRFYDLQVKLTDGKIKTLLGNAKDNETMYYLSDKISHYLNLSV